MAVDAHVQQVDGRWVAYYGPGVLANGWQPCDQPERDAYMPVTFDRLDRTDLPGGGAFFVEKSGDVMRMTPEAFKVAWEKEWAEWQRIAEEMAKKQVMVSAHDVSVEQRRRAAAEGRKMIDFDRLRIVCDIYSK